MGMLNRVPPDDAARGYAAAALPLLDRAADRDGRDWPVIEARAGARLILGRPEEALADFEAVLAARPESEGTLFGAGTLSLKLNRVDAARGYLERAARVNPWRPDVHLGLAVASFRRGEWERAAGECQRALRLDPASDRVRRLLIQCLLWDGRKARAREEYEGLRQMTPEGQRKELAQWLDAERQRAGR